MALGLPDEFLKKAAEVSENLLPLKSRGRYEEEFNKFGEWCNSQNISLDQVSDEVMLVYLSEQSVKRKPFTLWSHYSMIKSILKVKQNINASKFNRTVAFLKRQSVGYVPKKSNVLSANEVTKFIMNAPDDYWLLAKVILCLGIFGACRRDDLLTLTIDDVKDNDSYFLVWLKDGKTHRKRSFTITDEGCEFKPCSLVRKYMTLRPKHCSTQRFLVSYRNGKCFSQNVGCHGISTVPKKVAVFLKLENPESYTGHALRRSSASMLVEGGGDLLTLKRHVGWRSSSVAEGYVQESIARKINVSKKLFSTVVSPSTSNPSSITSSAATSNENMIGPEETDSGHYFTLHDIFQDKTDKKEKNEKIVQNGKNENLMLLQNKLANKIINITNNQNCTVNVTFQL